MDMGSMRLTDKIGSNYLVPRVGNNSITTKDMETKNNNSSSIWMPPSSLAAMGPLPSIIDKPNGSLNPPIAKLSCSGVKGHGLGADVFYKDFSMVDIDSSFENYDELFGVSKNLSEQFFVNVGIESLFGIRDMPGVEIDTHAAKGMLMYKAKLCDMHLAIEYLLIISEAVKPNQILVFHAKHVRTSHFHFQA